MDKKAKSRRILMKRISLKIPKQVKVLIPNQFKCSIKNFYKNKPRPINKAPFYKIYNYSGPLSLRSVDIRGLIDFDLGVFYNRIPKAGNSTIVGNLHELKYGVPVTSLEKTKRSFLMPSQMSRKQVKLFNRLFKFTMVRNPYTRILSAYLDKIVNDTKEGKLAKKSSDHRITTFYEFCKYLENGGLYSDPHWAPQTSILLLPIDKFDYVGLLENIDIDLQVIMNKITGDKNDFRTNTYAPHKTNAREKLKSYYDKKTLEIINRLYVSDFEVFGYQYEL